MTRNGRVSLTAIALVLAVATAASAATPALPTPPSDMGGALPFEGTRWILRSYRAQDGSTATPVAESSATFSDGLLLGVAACNGMGGEYLLDGIRLTIGALSTRARLCTDPATMSQEVAALDGLRRTTSWWRDGTDLVLYDDAGTELLRYLALEPRIWVPEWAPGEPVPEAYARVRFSKGEFWGQGPCNRLSGEYAQDGPSLVIRTGSTKMSCGPTMDELERTFIDGLHATAAYAIDAGTLVLLDAAGDEVRRFREAGR